MDWDGKHTGTNTPVIPKWNLINDNTAHLVGKNAAQYGSGDIGPK